MHKYGQVSGCAKLDAYATLNWPAQTRLSEAAEQGYATQPALCNASLLH
jgi:hypothetical protein